jgi:hypothetical protein
MGCEPVMKELPGTATHKHKCEQCGFVWRHSNECAGSVQSHVCAVCTHVERWWYEGPEEPSVHPSDKDAIAKLRNEYENTAD